MIVDRRGRRRTDVRRASVILLLLSSLVSPVNGRAELWDSDTMSSATRSQRMAPTAAVDPTPAVVPTSATLRRPVDGSIENAPVEPQAAPSPQRKCGPNTACTLGQRRYWFQPPDSWDGVTPLPVLLHFHGRKRNGAHVLKNPKVADPANQHGVVLVAPDGVEGDWSFDSSDPRDVVLTDAILADLPNHLPIDRSRVFLSGFSNGAAMASRVACDRGDAYAGYLPIAGFLRGTAPEDCTGGPANVLEVHGRTDAVYKAPRHKQTEASDYVFWRETASCAPAASQSKSFHVYQCSTWSDCAPGGRYAICLHKYGHILPKSWLPYALGQLLRDAPLAPTIDLANRLPAEQ